MKEATGAGRTQQEKQLAALGEDGAPLGTDLSLEMQAKDPDWSGGAASTWASEGPPGAAASSRSCCSWLAEPLHWPSGRIEK